jgi:hypothetical protein
VELLGESGAIGKALDLRLRKEHELTTKKHEVRSPYRPSLAAIMALTAIIGPPVSTNDSSPCLGPAYLPSLVTLRRIGHYIDDPMSTFKSSRMKYLVKPYV